MTGGGGGQSQPEATYQEQPMQTQYAQQQPQQGGVCAYELQQFMNCAQNTSDISFCQDFNEALKQCKQAYGKYSGCHWISFMDCVFNSN